MRRTPLHCPGAGLANAALPAYTRDSLVVNADYNIPMTNPFTRFPTTRRTPRWAHFRQIAIHALVALGLVAVSNVPLSITCHAPSESEAPVEHGKSPGEGAMEVPNGMRICRRQAGPAVQLAVQHGEARTIRTATASRPGHRLHNNLLAPLRC